MIFIVGPHNSGKTTLAKSMVDFGFIHVETGDIIRQKYNEINPESSFRDWARKNNTENPHFFDDFILDIVNFEREKNKDCMDKLCKIVITGNRQIEGIKYLMEKMNNVDMHANVVFYLDAPVEELYLRQTKRKDRIVPGLNFAIFKDEYLAFDEDMGLGKIKGASDFIIDSSKPVGEILREVQVNLETKGYNFEMQKQFKMEEKINYGKKIR